MKNPYVQELLLPPKMTSVKKSLWNTMIALAYTKQYHEITVKELCQKAYVARSTFYLNYKNSSDLLMEIEDYFIHQLELIFKNYIEKGYVRDHTYFYSDTIAFIKQHEKLFYLFLIQRPNIRFIQKWKLLIKSVLWQCREEIDASQELIPRDDLCLEIISVEMIAAHSVLLKYSKKETIDELKVVINEGLHFFADLYGLTHDQER